MLQAGKETSSNGLVYCMYELAQNPSVVDKLYDEVIGLCGPSGDITWEHVHAMRCGRYNTG